MRIRIKKGWHQEGREGVRLGPDIIPPGHAMAWTPVLWDGDDDPDFQKAHSVERVRKTVKTVPCASCPFKKERMMVHCASNVIHSNNATIPSPGKDGDPASGMAASESVRPVHGRGEKPRTQKG